MLKTAFLTLLALGIAIAGGAWSVGMVLDATHAIGSVTIGRWTAFPKAGAPDADPYSRARFAREGRLSLGKAEGVTFVAGQDASGAPLRRDCVYRIAGHMPPARLWTLYAADSKMNALPGVGRIMPALHSRSLLHTADGSVVIAVSRHPSPGNWLPVSGSGPMVLVLTLFDSPVSNGAGVVDMELPNVLRTGCDG